MDLSVFDGFGHYSEVRIFVVSGMKEGTVGDFLIGLQYLR